MSPVYVKNKLKPFATNAKLAAIPDNPDAQIMYHDTIYFLLADNFR